VNVIEKKAKEMRDYVRKKKEKAWSLSLH